MQANFIYAAEKRLFVFQKCLFQPPVVRVFGPAPRPCDDRLRFCDLSSALHKRTGGNRLDLVMTACGFVTSQRAKHTSEFKRLDLVMTACGFVTCKHFLITIFNDSFARPCDDRLRFCDKTKQNIKERSFNLDLVMTACGFVT